MFQLVALLGSSVNNFRQIERERERQLTHAVLCVIGTEGVFILRARCKPDLGFPCR
jgi:hypothetical protein